MIYTLTVNPALDKELQVPAIHFDEVLKAQATRLDAGGKGFNVSRQLARLQLPSTALAFAGGKTGDFLESALQAEGIRTHFIPIPGETRTNISIVEAASTRHIKVNESGPSIPAQALAELLSAVGALGSEGDIWALCGSLPPAAPPDLYAQLITLLHAAGALVCLDTSGAALPLGIQARPWLIKPNLLEASELIGEPGDADPRQIAERLFRFGAENVLLSLGAQGALLVNDSGVWSAIPPAIQLANPIGAGDAALAGLLYAHHAGMPWAECLRFSVACGSAAASLPGTALPDLTQIEAILPQVRVESR